MAMSAQDRVAAVAAQGEVVTSEDELAAMDAPALRNFIRSRDASMNRLRALALQAAKALSEVRSYRSELEAELAARSSEVGRLSEANTRAAEALKRLREDNEALAKQASEGGGAGAGESVGAAALRRELEEVTANLVATRAENEGVRNENLRLQERMTDYQVEMNTLRNTHAEEKEKLEEQIMVMELEVAALREEAAAHGRGALQVTVTSTDAPAGRVTATNGMSSPSAASALNGSPSANAETLTVQERVSSLNGFVTELSASLTPLIQDPMSDSELILHVQTATLAVKAISDIVGPDITQDTALVTSTASLLKITTVFEQNGRTDGSALMGAAATVAQNVKAAVSTWTKEQRRKNRNQRVKSVRFAF